MFDLESKIKKTLGSIFWQNGADYFNNDRVKNIQISRDDEEKIHIKGNVLGNEKYSTNITIDNKKQEISMSCSCPAFQSIKKCKHIAGLTMKIEDMYNISDSLQFVERKTGKTLDISQNQETISGEKNISKNKIPDISDFLMDENFFEKMHQNPELMTLLGIKPQLIQKTPQTPQTPKRKKNKLAIFEKMYTEENHTSEAEEEKFYKIKLFFVEKGYEKIPDILLKLYKCKIQKNGKLSSGALVKKEQLSNAPLKIQELKPYLESMNTYYWSGTNFDYSTFQTAQKNFISTLWEFDEVFDSENELLRIHREIFQLKIGVVKEKNTYAIHLLLQSNTRQIKLNGFNIFGYNGKKYFACLSGDNHLIFFHSELNYEFVKQLNEKEIILNKEEFKELKKKKIFSYIIEHTATIDALDLHYENIAPKVKLRIEIPNDYSVITVEHIIHYDGIEISFKESQKEIIVEGKRIIKREREKEYEQLNHLGQFKISYDDFKENIGKKYITDEIGTFFDEIEKVIEGGITVEYKQPTKRLSVSDIKINLKVTSKMDFFDIESTVMIGEQEIEDAVEILSQIKKGRNYITLKNGHTIFLKNNISKEAKNLEALGIGDKNIGKTVQVGKYNIGLLKDDAKNTGDLFFQLDKDTTELKNKFKNFKEIEHHELPKKSKIILRDYQKIGVDWIHFLEEYGFSGILADDMGLGKTIQTLAFLENKYSGKNKLGKTLIISPTSLVLNWLDEAEKFTPNLKIEYIKDGKMGFPQLKKDTQIVLVSYGIIANIVEKFGIEEHFEYIIIDEAQNIKNPVAQRTKTIIQLKSKHRLALSGTPIENNLVELWSIFNFLMPGFLGNLNHFKSEYASQDKEILDILSRKVKPFILRRTKEEVLKELPPKVEEYIKLEMEPKQKAFYSKLKNTYKLLIEKKLQEEGLDKSRFAVLDALLKLRQACLMPELVKLDGNDLKESIKLDYLDESIEEMVGNGHNLLIFSQFTGFLAYVKELLNKKGIPFHYLDGQTLPKDRKKLVDSFNAGTVNIFIISLKAGGTGLNLTAADYVIHLDPWWNPAVENQATDRAHRMGQQKTVFVQKLIVKDTIEEKILLLQESKKKLIDDMFSGDFSGKLEKSDIDFIFS